MPALSRMRRERAQLLVGVEHRAAHQAVKVGTRRNQCVERIEVGLDGFAGLFFERELEQGRGVAACHSGDDRVFACHGHARFDVDTSQAGRRPGRGAQIIGIQEGIPILEDVAEARGTPHEIKRLANTACTAAQHAEALPGGADGLPRSIHDRSQSATARTGNSCRPDVDAIAIPSRGWFAGKKRNPAMPRFDG